MTLARHYICVCSTLVAAVYEFETNQNKETVDICKYEFTFKCMHKHTQNDLKLSKIHSLHVFLSETKQCAANADPFGFRSTTNRNNASLHGHVTVMCHFFRC
jgi:hypothetical protein